MRPSSAFNFYYHSSNRLIKLSPNLLFFQEHQKIYSSIFHLICRPSLMTQNQHIFTSIKIWERKTTLRNKQPCFINCLLIIRPLFDTQFPNGYYPYFQLKVKIIAVTFLTKKWSPAKFLCVQIVTVKPSVFIQHPLFLSSSETGKSQKKSLSTVLKLSLI